METLKNSRKEFIGKSLGAFGASLVGSLFLESCTGNQEHEKEEMVKVLTADGQLINIPRSQVVNHKTHVTNAEARKGIHGKNFLMVIDLAKCDGCGKCTTACNKMHFIPPSKEWIEVLKMQDSPETASYWFPKTCMHCDNPPCTKVCPVDATFKREDGIVAIDNERCVGCRFCMAACPYSVRLFKLKLTKKESSKQKMRSMNRHSLKVFTLQLLLPIAMILMAISSSAQKDSSGVYMTAEDFLQGKMEYAINCKIEKHRINPHDFFNQKCVKVVHRDSVYMIDKKDIYGVRLCNGSTYRYFKNIFYPVLNPKEPILIYRIIPVQSPKTYPKVVDYYFSKTANTQIQKLTYENLRDAFPENPVFQIYLRDFFSHGENLFEIDNHSGCFKLNMLYKQSLALQNIKP